MSSIRFLILIWEFYSKKSVADTSDDTKGTTHVTQPWMLSNEHLISLKLVRSKEKV